MIPRVSLTFIFCCLAGLVISAPTGAWAGLYDNCELDGDPTDAVPGPLPDDWDYVNDTGGNSGSHSGLLSDPPPTGIFSSGTDLDEVHQWSCTDGSLPFKDEIIHGMAAVYSGNFLYFGGDRYGQNGDAYIGCWFLQNPASCTGAGPFEGVHADGDVFVLASFTLGSTSIVPRVFLWKSDSTGSDGKLDSIAVDSTIAIAKINGVEIGSPWPYEAAFPCPPPGGFEGCYPPGAFFEGGVALGALGMSGSFSAFLLETRSSQTLTALRKDFLIGELSPSTEISPSEGSTPREFFLSPVAPNPFNPTTEIRFGIPAGSASSRVNLAVFDPSGRRVKTLVDQDRGPGTYRVLWNGTDERERPVASGIYFCRITWGDRSETERMVLAK